MTDKRSKHIKTLLIGAMLLALGALLISCVHTGTDGEKIEWHSDVTLLAGGEVPAKSVSPSKVAEPILAAKELEPGTASRPTTFILDEGLTPVADGSRLALIVGNSSYKHMNALSNPANDATDMQRLLEQVGFETTLLLNGSLGEIEAASRTFVDNAQAEHVSTTLFFYAGHAVQYEGSNYLIPVDANITREYELISKAYSMDSLLKGLERSSADLNLLILDACRDNPFSVTRGGERGLSAMGFGSSESMVVFATAPGRVAEDGDGENSPFTRAMKEHLLTPDLEIRQLIAQVSKSVQDRTGGRQVPWVNTSFTGQFYFLTAEQEMLLRQLQLQTLSGDLAALEAELQEKQAAIDQAQSAEEVHRLEIEQRRLEAQATAKRLEEERVLALQEAAERRLAALEKEAIAKEQLQSQLSEEGKALQQLAQQRRSELARLAQQQSQASGVIDRLQTVAQFEQTIVDVMENYAETIRLTNVEFEKLKNQQVASYLTSKPRAPWETQEEFGARIERFEAPLKRENVQEIATIEGQRDAEIAELTKQMDTYKKELSRQEFAIGASMTSVEVLPFDVAGKYFPMTITSQQANLPFTTTVHYRITATDYDAMGVEYARIEDAANAEALVATIYYTVEEIFPLFWELTVKRVVVNSLLESDRPTVGLLQNFSSASFVQGDVKEYRSVSEGRVWNLYAIVPIETFPLDASILVDGKKIGVGKAAYTVAGGDAKTITITARDTTGLDVRRSVAINNGLNPSVLVSIAKVGGIGPAGGYVFYDKGSYSDGWRYLEAAPAGWSGKTEDPRYEFGGYGTTIGGTGTAVGSGRTNTQRIVQKLGSGNYAARIAANYVSTVGGVRYDDWFLPSKNELNEMYKNLHKKGLGGFSAYYYWSSSEISFDFAWYQYFINGNQYNYYRGNEGRVRPVRAF